MNTKKNTLTVPAHNLRWALGAALAAASKDDVTPVLTTVQWTISGGKIRLIATDRYRVHEAIIDAPKGTTEGEFLMHREQAAWLLANNHKPARVFRDQVIRVTWTDADGDKPARVTAEVLAHEGDGAPAFIYTADSVKGNFPPVRGLFAKAAEGEGPRLESVALSPSMLTGLSHLAYYRGEPLIFTLPNQTGGRAAPMLVQNT